MELFFCYDWNELDRRVIRGYGKEMPWSKAYAESVIAGETKNPIVSVFVDSMEPPVLQVRVSRGGKYASVIWIDELGRPALKYQFSATGGPGEGAPMFFPEGCDLRPGHMFLTDLYLRTYRSNGHMGAFWTRQYAADGRTRLLREGFEHDGTPIPDGPAIDWWHDPDIDVTSDSFWHPWLASLDIDELQGLLAKDRPGVKLLELGFGDAA